MFSAYGGALHSAWSRSLHAACYTAFHVEPNERAERAPPGRVVPQEVARWRVAARAATRCSWGCAAEVRLIWLWALRIGPESLTLALAVAAISVWWTLQIARWLGTRSRKRRAARAGRAERDAARVLTSLGYEVLGRQVRRTWSVLVDGRELGFELIADYLVRRDHEQWVAEVKTGARSLDLRHAPTRRQLLEYREAFGVNGVLLVDAEGNQIQRVHFLRSEAMGARKSALFYWPIAAIAAIAAFALGLFAGVNLCGALAP